MRAFDVQPWIDEVVDIDVVVVGSGVAGLTAALDLPTRRVALLTKADLGGGSSSRWAQGGVAGALGQDDSPRLHSLDTLRSGDGLCRQDIVDTLTHEGPQSLRRLMALGGRFDQRPDGALQLGQEGAHSRRRILHAGGDATGREMVRALVAAVRQRPSIGVHERTFARDLVLDAGRVVGVLAFEERQTGPWKTFYRAPAVVLATGGAGQLFAKTTNPVEATADGLAMAARAGAQLVDLAFVQFHPTALDVAQDPLPLVTEALRGEGSHLVNETGYRFMVPLHPMAELAPRDVVARAIRRQQKQGHQIFLDARQAVGQAFPERFPTVFEFCRQADLDPRLEPIPVTPAAHYTMGGIAVDAHGRASLAGLWACGEVASTGVHGANRLASNSLLEALVFGSRVAADIETYAEDEPLIQTPCVGQIWRDVAPTTAPVSSTAAWSAAVSSTAGQTQPATAVRRALRKTMWDDVGVERDEDSLHRALDDLRRLHRLTSVQPWTVTECEVGNLLTAARCVTTAAWLRRESRGAHCRSDYPDHQGEIGERAYFVYRPTMDADTTSVDLQSDLPVVERRIA